MRLVIVAVGERLPAWADTAVAEYLKRLPRDLRVEVVAVRPERRAGQSTERIKSLEARRILDKCPPAARLVTLDEHGREPSTRELAEQLAAWLQSGRDVCLVIGGADGLAPELVQQAEAVLSLSRLTLPHALARVVLAEQLYRAWSLLAGHPYHRD